MELPMPSMAPGTPRHPLFYYPFLGNPFIPMVSREAPVLSNSLVPMTDNSPKSVTTPQNSNFSINKILENPSSEGALARVSSSNVPMPLDSDPRNILNTAKMIWLHQMACSQNQNLIQKSSAEQKKVAKKRKLGRNPRIPFTQQQIDCLEKKYSASRYLSSLDVVALSKELDLSEARVKIWFQNRRARERRDKRIDLPIVDNSSHPTISPITFSAANRMLSVPMWSPTTSHPLSSSPGEGVIYTPLNCNKVKSTILCSDEDSSSD